MAKFRQTGERVGVVLVNFGEPVDTSLTAVESYLERIFLQNVDLEEHRADAALDRARELAATRAPGLVREYERIGGSPLNAQADAQAKSLAVVLKARGRDALTYSAFQFTEPSIESTIHRSRSEGVERLIVLPVYPLCGRSTTVAAIERARAAVDAGGWDVPLVSVSGWHHDPAYGALRAKGIRRFASERGLDLHADDTLLYFSVHGTPIKYLDEGNRYDRYVEEHTRDLAARLGVSERYAVGFQNHSNRRIEWTRPDNEALIEELVERRLLVVPISFMHEQSETLAELDQELREHAEGLGKELHRVPVPHDDADFIHYLAELLERVCDESEPDGLSRCRCCPLSGTWCTNGSRELPASPFAGAGRSHGA